MGDKEEKKAQPKRLGGLNTGLGRSDARGAAPLRSSDGAGPSTQAAALGSAAVPRKMRFLPTNFARARKAEESQSTDITSLSASVSKSEGVFEDLQKAAHCEASWQRRPRGRGGGAGAGTGGRGPAMVTTFGGGAGDMKGRRPTVGGGGSWGGRPGRGGLAAGASTAKDRAVRGKAGEAQVKDEEELPDWEEAQQAQQGERGWESEEDEGGRAVDPWNYLQYYPTTLPTLEPGMVRGSQQQRQEDAVPPDLLTLPEDLASQRQELEFLHDIESNDGRLLLFQLPSALPIPVSTGIGGGDPGPGVVVDGRPARLSELPTSRIGKLLVFESGALKMQIGDVLLDVSPGVPCQFRQDVAVVNPLARQCVMLAPVHQRVVCQPDLDTLLSDEPLPEWERTGKAATHENGAVAMDVDGSMAGGQQQRRQQQQQQQQQDAAGARAQVKEEPEVQSPRARVQSPRVQSPTKKGAVHSPRVQSPRARGRKQAAAAAAAAGGGAG